jgi:tight adherence protein B
VVLAVAAATPGLGQTPSTPVFGARVETVYVDAFVTREGQAVVGLTEADFELKDEGVARRIELVSSDAVPLVAVLAFDTSSSVAGPKLAALQAAGAAFLDGLRPADEAALITFNEELGLASEPTVDRARVKAALGALRARGGTAVLDALYAAVALPSSRARSLVVLFSDGEDNLSFLGQAQVKAVAEKSNALVHVVGIAPGPRPGASAASLPGGFGGRPSASEDPHVRDLRQIAEATGGRFWTAESPDRLRQTFAAIAEAMRHRYILRFDPEGGVRPGWHRLELKLRGKPGRVEARRGYWVAGQ